MKTLQYIGFTGKQCSCQYKVGTVANDLIVVFVQGPLNQTSITNLIEVLASKVLGEDLSEENPQSVRFFEHYPHHLNPLREWQEVVFEERHEVAKDKGLMAKLLSFTKSENPQSTWIVDSPYWKPVPTALREQLAAFIL
ncbi:hypothetical protein [Paracidovorax valerianellae]|uniref:Uncharacterized protein n=1 Tax=Paracidovorax valerianellae TaxID=187868 RepID=A0A1G7F6H0_9BURK|nr:hypothetical protein [Paracidovorax valerianellae]MDA8445626.1 hypothetical protein [Paracidovorax valerianellae]SDE71538.1 hypothetical protein SAMN05192589_12711 [Paracidovorax valerianellae]